MEETKTHRAGTKRKKLDEGFQPYVPTVPTQGRERLLNKVCVEIDNFMSQEGLRSAVEREKLLREETLVRPWLLCYDLIAVILQDPYSQEISAEVVSLKKALEKETSNSADLSK